HDLEELMQTCDRLTVLRDGQLITTIEHEDMEEKSIKQHMVGREVSEKYYREDYGRPISDEVVLRAENVTTGYGMLQNCSFELHRGELLGIGGLSHCGMHELAQAIFGQTPVVTGKVIHVPTGDCITSPIQAINHGMGYVSKDRDKDALVLGASIKDNVVSAALDQIANKMSVIWPKKEKKYVKEQIELLSIKCENMEQFVQYLSGGNKQKVSVAKWVGRGSEILILDCPTRGVDIGVKAAMYQIMENMLAEGKSILLVSEELTELIGMSDRLLILKDGRIVKEILRDPNLTESDIIDVMI
ncbi:MAG: sugar ABC transporter ATP-binding protein, partial [Lachnospiraceae bacterium]|nr:sugar ABC transporter ATP-binding protein [Lachnospiraceae bacterium]MBQ9123377.1 sugar ABC transporter ATP-binding protein [Lachnospiraceae bacterium]